MPYTQSATRSTRQRKCCPCSNRGTARRLIQQRCRPRQGLVLAAQLLLQPFDLPLFLLVCRFWRSCWAAMVSSGWALASCSAVATQSRHATRSYTTPVADGARSALRAVGPWRCGGSSWASPFSEHTNVVRLTSGSLDPAEVADLAILSSMFNDSPLMRRLQIRLLLCVHHVHPRSRLHA